MHIVLAIRSHIPALKYGGVERYVVWLGRALMDMGHKITFMANEGSTCDFAPLIPIRPDRPLSAQVGADVDIIHDSTGLSWDDDPRYCQTFQGNMRDTTTMHPNTIFVSANHARNHGGEVFVHNGVDPRIYPAPDLEAQGGHLTFLAKAAWKVKNVKGAIRVARKAGVPIDVLGGNRLNFKMGFRLTLDPNARFKGMVDDAGKAKYLRPASGLLFPVRWHEPFGIAVIEAMYFGLPVFATPYGSLPELVPEFAGKLSIDGDELADAIRHIGQYDRRAVHAHFMANFTAEVMAKRYLALYERVAAGEKLHPGPIEGKVARGKELLAWTD